MMQTVSAHLSVDVGADIPLVSFDQGDGLRGYWCDLLRVRSCGIRISWLERRVLMKLRLKINFYEAYAKKRHATIKIPFKGQLGVK